MWPGGGKGHLARFNHFLGGWSCISASACRVSPLNAQIDCPATVRRKIEMLCCRIVVDFPSVKVHMAKEASGIIRRGGGRTKDKASFCQLRSVSDGNSHTAISNLPGPE